MANLVIDILSRDKSKEGFDSATSRTKKLDAELKKASKTLKRLGVIGAGVAVLAVNSFANYDTKIREISTLLNNVTETELKSLGTQVQESAVKFGQSIDSMAKAKYDIISAGFNDIAESQVVLEASSKLAVAGVSEVSKTADVLTTVLNAYNFEADQASKVSDVLFTTVRLGKTTINELSSAFGNAVSIAPTLGIKVEEVAAGIATLTANGIRTDEAVTALQATFTALLSPSQALSKKLESLGYDSGKAAIEALGLQGTLAVLTDGVSETEKAALFPNVRAMKSVFPLTGQASAQFKTKLEELSGAMKGVGENADATKTAFDKVADGIGFKINKIKTLLSTTLIKIGEALAPFVETMITLIDGFNQLDSSSQRGIVTLTALTGVVYLLRGAIIALSGPVGIITSLIGIGLVSALASSKTASERAAEKLKDYNEEVKNFTASQLLEEQRKINKQLDEAKLKYDKVKKAAKENAKNASLRSSGLGLSTGLSDARAISDVKNEIEDLTSKLNFLKEKYKEVSSASKDIESKEIEKFNNELNKMIEGLNNKPPLVNPKKEEDYQNKVLSIKREFLNTYKEDELKNLEERLSEIDKFWKGI